MQKEILSPTAFAIALNFPTSHKERKGALNLKGGALPEVLDFLVSAWYTN